MATDPAYMKALNDGQDHARKALRNGGYASGGAVSDEHQDKRDIARGVHKHEANMHPGEKETKLARGGRAHPSRTNVIVEAGGGEGEKQAAMQQGMQAGRQQGIQLGARLAAQKMAQGPMAGAQPPQAPRPMPAMPPPAGMGAKRGGGVRK